MRFTRFKVRRWRTRKKKKKIIIKLSRLVTRHSCCSARPFLRFNLSYLKKLKTKQKKKRLTSSPPPPPLFSRFHLFRILFFFFFYFPSVERVENHVVLLLWNSLPKFWLKSSFHCDGNIGPARFLPLDIRADLQSFPSDFCLFFHLPSIIIHTKNVTSICWIPPPIFSFPWDSVMAAGYPILL